ncbi:MAG: 2-hydroxyacid dehydrogenase [Rhodospirillales bacterium]|jgi:lactate dehydrogenase-like 2-hydroxyacid dehydrogenase
MSQQVVIMSPVPESVLTALSVVYEVLNCPTFSDREAFYQTSHDDVVAVLTNGTQGIKAAEMDQLPNLKIIGAFGAGFENIDVKAARAKGIAVTHGPGTNSKAVADHAMALMLAVSRHIVPMHAQVQEGEWTVSNVRWPSVYGKRLGIMGLGRIGMEIAKRATGFDLEIGYHNRSQRSDVDYPYFDDVPTMAKWCDYLICSSPGGDSTHHAINTEVLENLGPDGVIVNIGRGSIVDTDALVRALVSGTISGAGLDVLEDEPKVPKSIIGLKNLTMTPHIAGNCPEATIAKLELYMQNVELCLNRNAPLTPVPKG